MTRYLISFPSEAMDHIPDEEMPDVDKASHAVVREAQAAGVWIFGGGLDEDVEPVVVAGDGRSPPAPPAPTRSAASPSWTCPTRKAALEWAAKIAVAWRCAQEVSEFMLDPLV
jgi:hypothetical protein